MPAAQIDDTVNTDQTNTESIIYLYTDHLMTNRLATNQAQAIVWRWEGEAFGNTPAQELAAKIGPFSTAIALEFACIGTSVSAPVCMVSMNILQGLTTAYSLSACQRVSLLCKERCEVECPLMNRIRY